MTVADFTVTTTAINNDKCYNYNCISKFHVSFYLFLFFFLQLDKNGTIDRPVFIILDYVRSNFDDISDSHFHK